MLECAICNAAVSMADAHIDHRGWLCDGCYFQNQPWHTPDEGGEGGGVGC